MKITKILSAFFLLAFVFSCIGGGSLNTNVNVPLPSPPASPSSKYVAKWDANLEKNLAGYYLYWKDERGSYSKKKRRQIAVSNNPSYDLRSLKLPSGRHIIAVTAYDTYGNESGFSKEVAWDH
jgi:hypothetical protein